MRIGIIMGGASREREISFAGGRTVYDSLDMELFTAIPIFVCPRRKFVHLDWEYLYKGTIRDFFPPGEYINDPDFAFNSDNLSLSEDEYIEMLSLIGTPIRLEDLNRYIDFAFLTLHGSFGEDGIIQGVLEWLGIPYTGTGILGSAIGIDKGMTNLFMRNIMPDFAIQTSVVPWNHNCSTPKEKLKEIFDKGFSFPFVLKNPIQGSSIGVKLINNEQDFEEGIMSCGFIKELLISDWNLKTNDQKIDYLNSLTDNRTGLGIPLFCENGDNKMLINTSQDLMIFLNESKDTETLRLIAIDAPVELIVEEFIEGIEFSVIVIETPEALSNQKFEGRKKNYFIALPPTEILKNKEIYDYHDKYLAGQAKKITPIRLEDSIIEKIGELATILAHYLRFEVYARIDGIVKIKENEVKIYFNDPNTTSGMLPSSFLFHQAAEIGFTPTNFLTYLIEHSLNKNIQRNSPICNGKNLDIFKNQINHNQEKNITDTKRIGVILGGYSTERHISVESGRNVYQKLAAQGKYKPVAIFLLKNEYLNNEQKQALKIDDVDEFSFWEIPINILLKDNSDDIAEKIIYGLNNDIKIPPYIQKAIDSFSEYKTSYILNKNFSPGYIPVNQLSEVIDFAFIGLHGRPGEDGTIQKIFEEQNIPYSGSDPNTSSLTMNKVNCNEYLKTFGIEVPLHFNVTFNDKEDNFTDILTRIEKELNYPIIAKPKDEGCSSAVKILRNRNEFMAYTNLSFRDIKTFDENAMHILGVLPYEEFPIMNEFMVEEYLNTTKDFRLIEMTVGFVRYIDESGSDNIQVFTPSLAVSKGAILSLEEKFLAGEGQNITPAVVYNDKVRDHEIIQFIKEEIKKVIIALNLQGYARIDFFLKLEINERKEESPKVIILEVNSLPGMTPATCIFHQAAIEGLKPIDFINQIIDSGFQKLYLKSTGN